MSRKAKPIEPKPADQQADASAGVTVSPDAAAKDERAPAGWSIAVSTRKGRTQPRYRIGRAFGPESVTIAVDELTTEELQALHEDMDLVVTPVDDSEENGN